MWFEATNSDNHVYTSIMCAYNYVDSKSEIQTVEQAQNEVCSPQ